MNKFKKVLLGALSVLTLGLFVATGAKVEAATSHTATYEWRAGDGKGSSGDMFYFNNGSMTTTSTDFEETIDGITFSKYDTPTSSSRTLIITLTETEWSNNTVTAYVYLYTTTKARTITIGGTDKGKTALTGIQYFTDNLTSSANRIVLGGDGVVWCGVDLVLTSTVGVTYTATFNLNSGLYDGNSTYTDSTAYEHGDSLTLPDASKMTRDGYNFNGWTTSTNQKISKTTTTFEMESDVTFTAIWKSANLGYSMNQSNIIASNKLTEALEDAYDTIFTLNTGLTPAADTNYTMPDGNKDSIRINTGGTSFNSASNMRTIDFTAPSDGVVTIWWWGSATDRYVRVVKGDATAINDSTILKTGTMTSDNITNKKAQILTMSVTNGTSYRIASTQAINIFKVEFIQKSVQVIQQEVPNQTIGEDDATYIRFVAIVKGVEDINSSDFTFKIYREKDETVQSITRTVSTYNVLKSSGSTYVAAIPGEASHTFDGACETEFYALFVIGLTDATYKGYTVYAGFTYGGTEYPTTGYTFN